MTLSIATPDDFKRIHGLLIANVRHSKYNGFFQEDNLGEAVKTYLDPDTLQQRIALILQDDEGKDIGLAIFELIYVSYTDLSFARIVALYIDPEHQGKGYMDEIYEAFEYWGKRAGAKYYSVGVSKDGADITNRGYKQYEVMYLKEVN